MARRLNWSRTLCPRPLAPAGGVVVADAVELLLRRSPVRLGRLQREVARQHRQEARGEARRHAGSNDCAGLFKDPDAARSLKAPPHRGFDDIRSLTHENGAIRRCKPGIERFFECRKNAARG